MKITSTFLIDEMDQWYRRYPEQSIKSIKNRATAEIGHKIVEMIPFKEIPAHRPGAKQFECEFVLLAKPDWDKLRNAIEHILLSVAVGASSPAMGARDVLEAIGQCSKP